MEETSAARPTPAVSVNTTQRASPDLQEMVAYEKLFPPLTSLITAEARIAHLTKWGIKMDKEIPRDTTNPNFTKEDKFILDLRVMANQAKLGVSPKAAIPNLNASIQSKLLKWHEISTEIEDSDPFDPKLFSVTFDATVQAFICSIPRSLTVLFYIAYLHDEFDFTGDNEGNKWKLMAREHNQRLSKAKKSDSITWCHAIVKHDTTFGPESTFRALETAFSACGITIDEKTFNRIPTKDKEQGSNKYHVDFHFEPTHIPRDRHGFVDLTGLMNIPADDSPFCTEFINTWFKPEYMLQLFGTCNECYKQKSICLCKEKKQDKRKSAGGSSSENAKRRIGARGAATSSSSFKF